MSFDDLTPDMFVRATSAVTTRALPPISRAFYFRTGDDGFNTFVGVQLVHCQRQLAALREFNATAVLLSADSERKFVGEGDEYPADYAKRLTREAARMDAEYSFVAMMNPVRLDGTPPPFVNDLDAVDHAIKRGELEVGLSWVACSRRFAHRSGVIFIDENGRSTRELSGTASEQDPFLHLLV